MTGEEVVQKAKQEYVTSLICAIEAIDLEIERLKEERRGKQEILEILQ